MQYPYIQFLSDLVFATGQSLDQQQELLELETENERLLLNILPRHVVPFFMPSRRHSQVFVLCLHIVTSIAVVR